MVKIDDRNYIERQSLQVFRGAPLNICMCGAKGYVFFSRFGSLCSETGHGLCTLSLN